MLARMVFYEVTGSGPPVVLLHAGGTDASIWDPQVAPLAERFTVLRFDARGYGRWVDPSGEPFSRVDDLLAVMDDAGLARAALVGESQGARVALETACTHPDRVTALVLASPAPQGTRVPGEAELVACGDIDGAIELAQRFWLAGPHRRLEDIDPALRERLAEMDRHATAGPPLGPERTSLPTTFDKIAAPTLIIVGELDRDAVHAHARRLAGEIPGARLEVVEGAGHLVNLERPAAFTALVERHAAPGHR
jgi:pimeloyl-ACP methyl ester carboxylesterase